LEKRIGAWIYLGVTNYSSDAIVVGCQLNQSGEPSLAPVRLGRAAGTEGIFPTSLTLASGTGGWLCAWHYPDIHLIFDTFVSPLNELPPVIRNFTRLPTGEAQFDLSGAGYYFGLEVSTNLVDWSGSSLGEEFYHLARG